MESRPQTWVRQSMGMKGMRSLINLKRGSDRYNGLAVSLKRCEREFSAQRCFRYLKFTA